MIILAIDTAGADCAAGLYDTGAGVLLAARQETIGKGHAERLMAMIDEVFADSTLAMQDIDLIAVTVGPGSFTGIRVGVAAARGLALALSRPVVGVGTLEALADAAFEKGVEGPLMALIDARRGEIYGQLFGADRSPSDGPAAMTIEEARSRLSSVAAQAVGSGAVVVTGDEAEIAGYDIGAVARIAAGRPERAGKPAPLYLRAPDAKPQAGFAIERRA